MSVAILETFGPITLFAYNRCIELSSQYAEMKDLRSLFLTAAACTSEFRRVKMREEMQNSPNTSPETCLGSPGKGEDRNNKFIEKMVDFYIYNFKMSKMDTQSYWRLQTFMTNMPSCKELFWVVKKTKIQPSVSSSILNLI